MRMSQDRLTSALSAGFPLARTGLPFISRGSFTSLGFTCVRIGGQTSGLAGESRAFSKAGVRGSRLREKPCMSRDDTSVAGPSTSFTFAPRRLASTSLVSRFISSGVVEPRLLTSSA